MTPAQLRGMSIYYELYEVLKPCHGQPHEKAKELAIKQINRILDSAKDVKFWAEARKQITDMP